MTVRVATKDTLEIEREHENLILKLQNDKTFCGKQKRRSFPHGYKKGYSDMEYEKWIEDTVTANEEWKKRIKAEEKQIKAEEKRMEAEKEQIKAEEKRIKELAANIDCDEMGIFANERHEQVSFPLTSAPFSHTTASVSPTIPGPYSQLASSVRLDAARLDNLKRKASEILANTESKITPIGSKESSQVTLSITNTTTATAMNQATSCTYFFHPASSSGMWVGRWA